MKLVKELLCEKCNKILTDWLRKSFSEMHSGKKFKGAKYSTFLKRLSGFIFDSTGSVNASMYVSNFAEEMEEMGK